MNQRVREFWPVGRGHRGEKSVFGVVAVANGSNQRVVAEWQRQSEIVANAAISRPFLSAQNETPGDLSLGVWRKPVGRGNLRPYGRLPD